MIPSLILIVLAGMAIWQIASWNIANTNLQEDMRDLASQAGVHMGVVVPPSDEEMIRTVVGKAKEHGIELEPGQVTVRRTNPGEKATVQLAVDYTEPVSLLIFSFRLHFTASGGT